MKSSKSNHKQLTIQRCKIVFVGDACVGKTALSQVLQSGGSTFPKNYIMTVGAEYVVKQVQIPDTNIIVEFHIFDCAGQSIYNQVEMNSKYYENAAAVAVLFDIGSKESLLSCRKWLSAVRTAQLASGSNNSNLLGVVIGNKCEYRGGVNSAGSTSPGSAMIAASNNFDSRAEVGTDDGMKMAEELGGLKYFEVSAANNIGVEEPFKYLAMEFNKRYDETIARTEEVLFSRGGSSNSTNLGGGDGNSMIIGSNSRK